MFKFLLLLVMCQIVFSEMEDGISVVVSAGKSDCFFRELKQGDRMDLEVQVLSGGDVDISVVVLSPTGRMLVDEQTVPEVSTEISIEEDGPYKVCFDNTFSMYSEKVVYFDLGIDHSNRTGVDHAEMFAGLDLEKDNYENAKDIIVTLDKIGMMFETIQEMQTLFRSRYSRHHYLQNSNLYLVTWFSGASCALMLIVGLLQVYLIRSLFKENATRGMKSSL